MRATVLLRLEGSAELHEILDVEVPLRAVPGSIVRDAGGYHAELEPDLSEVRRWLRWVEASKLRRRRRWLPGKSDRPRGKAGA